MFFNSDYVILDNPNLLPEATSELPLGKLINVMEGPLESIAPTDELSISDLYLPQVAVREMEGNFSSNAVFMNRSNTGANLIASCIILKGNFSTTLKANGEGVWIEDGYQSLKFDPRNEFAHLCPRATPFHLVHLSMLPEFLFNLLPENESWSDGLREKIYRQERVLGTRQAAITQAQFAALHTIFNCPLEGKAGLMMIETSVIQLMLLQLHAQFKMEERNKNVGLSKRDQELAHMVLNHLEATFLDNHCLSSLAKHFGINANKLMSIFKKSFGVSIFDFIADLKMEYAKTLLQDEHLYVNEVAQRIGYKNPHHFSAAFKRKFGFSPSVLKQAC